MGFGVWGLGFGVWGLGFGVWSLEFGDWFQAFWHFGGVDQPKRSAAELTVPALEKLPRHSARRNADSDRSKGAVGPSAGAQREAFPGRGAGVQAEILPRHSSKLQ